jgi:hypothetical protein
VELGDDAADTLTELFTHERRDCANGRVELELEPYAHRWYRLRG